MAGRNTQISRIYKILTILEGAPHGLTVSDLSNRLADRGFEVNVRTVYRDLDALRKAGFPLDEKGKSDDNGTRWTLDKTAKIGQYLILSIRELVALFLAKNVLIPLKDTPFYEDLMTTFNKIEEKLGHKAQKFIEELTEEFQFEPGPRWGLGLDPDIIETVRAACTERHKIKAVYNSANSNSQRERILGPHYLYFAKGSLYLLAKDFEDNKTKTFSMPRVKSVAMMEDEFTDPQIDPGKYYESSFGVYHGDQEEEVEIEFSNKIAMFIKERRWHASQRIISKEGGAITLFMNVAITPELVGWIMGFSRYARVIKPERLMQEVVSEADAILDVYHELKKTS